MINKTNKIKYKQLLDKIKHHASIKIYHIQLFYLICDEHAFVYIEKLGF